MKGVVCFKKKKKVQLQIFSNSLLMKSTLNLLKMFFLKHTDAPFTSNPKKRGTAT